jgi:hypothetical protein
VFRHEHLSPVFTPPDNLAPCAQCQTRGAAGSQRYLLFIKRLDELQTLEEAKSTTLNIPLERGIFPEGFDGRRTMPQSAVRSNR